MSSFMALLIKNVILFKYILLLDDLKKYLGQLISLGFSIISDESLMLKRVGFSIIIILVKLFKYCIERIGDDDDDPAN